MASPSPCATIEKVDSTRTTSTPRFLQTTKEIMEGGEGVEISSQRIKEGQLYEKSVPSVDEDVRASKISEAPSIKGIVLGISLTLGNIPSLCIDIIALGIKSEKNGSDILKEGYASLEKELTSMENLVEGLTFDVVGAGTQGEPLSQGEVHGKRE